MTPLQVARVMIILPADPGTTPLMVMLVMTIFMVMVVLMLIAQCV